MEVTFKDSFSSNIGRSVYNLCRGRGVSLKVGVGVRFGLDHESVKGWGEIDKKMGLNHTAAILSPEGLKTFVFPQRNSFPNISTRGSGGVQNLWATSENTIIPFVCLPKFA